MEDFRSELEDGLSHEQKNALCLAIRGESFFLTGPGGTGKSETVKRIKAWFEKVNKKFIITGTTGIAAVNIGGRTLHSVLRMNPDMDSLSTEDYNSWVVEQLSLMRHTAGQKRKFNADLKLSQTFVKSLRELEYLIVDEVSMLSIDILEKMNALLQNVRRSMMPMGNLRCIFVGDFFQLPPVKKSKFLFESPLFWSTIQACIELTQCFRQEDSSFVDLLNRFRKGRLTDEDTEVLSKCLNKDVSKNGVLPTILQSRNMDVDKINSQKLADLEGSLIKFNLKSSITSKQKSLHPKTKSTEWKPAWKSQLAAFLRDLRLEDSIGLKVGAQVMLTYNLDVDGGLCNGARGVIVGFTTTDSPDDAKIFEKHDLDEPLAYPKESMAVVKFVNGRQVVVPQVRWTRQLIDADCPEANLQLVAWQVPLKLAWATTIHKSQGLTLDCVSISMDRSVFEPGQAQVAASRVKSLEGLSLLSFDKSVVKAHDKVLFFSQYSYDFLKDYQTNAAKESE